MLLLHKYDGGFPELRRGQNDTSPILSAPNICSKSPQLRNQRIHSICSSGISNIIMPTFASPLAP
jgi:hypothetical protein